MEGLTSKLQEVECPEPVEGEFFTYLLLCGDKSFYSGATSDLKNRLREHRLGEAAVWTRQRQPVKLVYFEVYTSLVAARRREDQIKGWTRKKKMNLIMGKWKQVTL